MYLKEYIVVKRREKKRKTQTKQNKRKKRTTNENQAKHKRKDANKQQLQIEDVIKLQFEYVFENKKKIVIRSCWNNETLELQLLRMRLVLSTENLKCLN